MPKLPHKLTQYLLVFFKVGVLILVGCVIYLRLFSNNELSWQEFTSVLVNSRLASFEALFFLILLTSLNWFFEIKKWQLLVSHIRIVSFNIAAIQALTSHATTLFTPMRAGEYGVKAMYFKKGGRKEVLKLNLLGNLLQMMVTTMFGVLGALIILNLIFPQWFLLGLIVCLLVAVFFFLGLKFKWFSRLGVFFQTTHLSSRFSLKVCAYALLRYLVFSHQFYVLLVFFNIEMSYFTALSIIATMYLLSSLVPVLSVFDVVLKGGIAVVLFGFFGIEALPILVISTVMWLFNTVSPAIAGSLLFFLLKDGKLFKNSSIQFSKQ